jgi:hypothetical protein
MRYLPAPSAADTASGLPLSSLNCSYVYLPPGSSMRDPVSLPNSMSDPLERRVFYRDPKPTLRKS